MWNWMSARRQPAARAREGDHLGDGRAELARRRSSHSASDLGLSAPYSVVGAVDLPDHCHERLVLQVRARRPAARGATCTPPRELSAGPMPESSSSCGERSRPQQQHLALGAPTHLLAARPCGTARSRAACSSTPSTTTPVRDLQVAALQRRAQERVGRAEAPAALLGDLEHRRAVLLGAVVVVDQRDPRSPRRPAAAARSTRAASAARTVRRTAERVVLEAPRALSLGVMKYGSTLAIAPARARLALATRRSRAGGRARRASRSSSSTRRGLPRGMYSERPSACGSGSVAKSKSSCLWNESEKRRGILMFGCGRAPASSSRTRTSGSSRSRAASTQPADPAPTIKSVHLVLAFGLLPLKRLGRLVGGGLLRGRRAANRYTPGVQLEDSSLEVVAHVTGEVGHDPTARVAVRRDRIASRPCPRSADLQSAIAALPRRRGRVPSRAAPARRASRRRPGDNWLRLEEDVELRRCSCWSGPRCPGNPALVMPRRACRVCAPMRRSARRRRRR